MSSSQMAVFAGGVDGALWQLTYDSNGGSWERVPGNGMASGVTIASAPAAVSPLTGRMAVYVRGSDNQLWQISHDGVNWGSWTPGGGLLASGLGAAVSPITNTTYLYAQDPQGSLGQGIASGGGVPAWQPGWSWLEYCCQSQPYDTALIGYFDTSSYQEDYINNIDVETGYLLGDGREQIVLAYRRSAAEVAIRLYDIQDRFIPSLMVITETYRTGRFPKLTTGDFDENGVDEIALLYFDHLQNKVRIEIFTLNTSAWVLDSTASAEFPLVDAAGLCTPPWVLVDQSPERTFNIEAGDLNGDGDEEIVVSWDMWGGCKLVGPVSVTFRGYQARFSILDVANNVISPTYSEYHNHLGWDDIRCCSADTELALGDVDRDGVDEIVRTWPRAWDDNDWPDLYRDLQVLNAGYQITPTVLASVVVPGWARTSWQDELAVGDLDRDLVDEIVFYESDTDYDADWDKLWFYQLQDSSLQAIGDPFYFNPGYYLFSRIVTGDFTGDSVRVGAPTYRLQRATGDIIAILNEPPKHIDTLGGITYDINSTDTGTYAAYENEQSQSTEMSIQVQRDWGFADGMETCVGDPEGTHVKTSLDTTYGEHFEKTTTAFNQIDFGSEVKATSDDIVYYTGKDLQVWEYPVYEDNSRVPTGRIMVVFPLPGLSNTGTQEFYETGNSTCDFWYAPKHQINNVWSYAQVPAQLQDLDPEKGVLNSLQTVTVGPTEGEFWTRWRTITTTQQASSVNLGVDSMFEWQIGGDSFEVSAEPFGVGVSYEVHLLYVKGTLKNSYSASTLSTHEVVGSDTTTVRVHFNSIDTSGIYNYEVSPYLYWAKGGYLVLDYLTNPKNTTFWNRYNRPDPAFILPWTDGHCAGKEQFSKDIAASPPFAGNGETVIISATVHNLSNVGVNGVRVRFYLGEPGQNVQLGSDQIINLPTRGKVVVSVPWQASGTGEQRIYAVIDPNHEIAEMHDEATNSENNNNVAFGVVAMGDSGFVDPGAQIYFDYQFLTYTDTQDIPTNVFIPTAAMTETLRIEMVPLSPTVAIRHGFGLVAYKGGSDRDSSWDLTFNPVPAAIWFGYSDEDVAGLDENTLILHRYDSAQGRWVEGACGEYQRYPEENWMLVPICRTGDFALLSPHTEIFLPLIRR